MLSRKKTFWNADFGPFRPISHEILEPRILLSGDGLLSIAPDPLQDAILDTMPQVVQYAELLETNEQVEEEISQELDPSDTLNTDIYQPIFTLSVDDGDINDGVAPAQVDNDVADLSDELDGNVDNKITLAEAVAVTVEEPVSNSSTIVNDDGSMPVYMSDADLSIEYATSIEIRGPPQDAVSNTFEQPESTSQTTLDLPGMYLVDPTTDFNGQIVYLDFDGETGVTYNGPVIVEGINIPEFSADVAGLAGQESEIISQILSVLEQQFAGTGVLFTTTKPDPGTSYSTVFVGGEDSAFAEYGSFTALSEKVDFGNQNPSDNAFVFSDTLLNGQVSIESFADALAGRIAHETGHLIGFAHDQEDAHGNILSTVAAFADYYSNYRGSPWGAEYHNYEIIGSSGTYTFEVNDIAAHRETEWYVNGVYQVGENDSSGSTGWDPQYPVYCGSGTTNISAVVYYVSGGTWYTVEKHHWHVAFNRDPSDPGNPTASNITRTSATISWSGSTDPDGDTITYEVEYGKTYYWDGWTSGGTTQSTSKLISNLDPDYTYTVRVTARDGNGGSNSNTNTAAFKTLPPNRDPSDPGNPVASNVTRYSATISWSGSTDQDGDTITYEVEYGKTYYWDGWTSGGTTQSTSMPISNLDPDYTYTVRVTARDGNGGGNRNTNTAAFKTLANHNPSDPGNPTASDVTRTSATISWSGSTDSDGDTITYELEYGKTYAFDGWTSVGTTQSTSMPISGLEAGTAYDVRVTARDGNGGSNSNTNVNAFTTVPPNRDPSDPGNPTASDVTRNSATISWSGSTDQDGDTITYEIEYGKTYYWDGWTSGGTTQNTSMPISGLDPDYTYTVRVTARDGNGGSNRNTNTAAFKTLTGEAEILSIDKWWAYSGEIIDVELTVDIGALGNYELDIDIDDFFALNDWHLTNGAYVTVDNLPTQYNFSWTGSGKVDIPILSAGEHTIHIKSFVAPDKYVVEPIFFQLDGPGNAYDELETLFVSDREGISSLAELTFEDGFGGSISIGSLDQLAEIFAPLLWFNAGEYYTPISVDTPLSDGTLYDADGNPLSYPINSISDPNAYLDLPGTSPQGYRPSGNSTIYASVVPDIDNVGIDYLAINYWFYYPYSNWAEHDGYNNHESDWEGITVFLEREEQIPGQEPFPFLPTDVGYAQHEQHFEGISDGGQISPWSAAASGPYGDPNVFVGLGGHASYSFPGETDVGLFGITNTELHWGGNGIDSSDYSISFLDRAPELYGTSYDWALFPGLWGQLDLTGSGSGLDGDDGPRGPVFQGPEGIDNIDRWGLRWYNPWKWVGIDTPGGFDTTELSIGDGDGSILDNGEWTIITHGLSKDSYDKIIGHGDDGWMRQMALRIRQSSINPTTLDSNIAIHKMNSTANSFDDIISPGLAGWTEDGWSSANISVDNTNYHHILLYDWVDVSNYAFLDVNTPSLWEWNELFVTPPDGASDWNGYAEASADFLYALLEGNGIADDVNAVIGYSRGGVVMSEFTQRILTDNDDSGTDIDQVIYLDAEGGGILYEDDSFYAWDGVKYFTDNYKQKWSGTTGGLGNNTVPGSREIQADNALGTLYSHSNFPNYFIGNSDDNSSGLFLRNGLIVTQDTPTSISDALSDPNAYDPPVSLELFNGNFEYEDSTAGWWWHGGGDDATSAGGGVVENGHLVLEAGQFRTHNWSYVPGETLSLEFDITVTNLGSQAELQVLWAGNDGVFDELLESLPLNSIGIVSDYHYIFALPGSLKDVVGEIQFKLVEQSSGSPRVELDNITWLDKDIVSPEASLVSAPDINSGGGASQPITIRYTDNSAIKYSSLDGSDIRITGPNGYNQLATFMSSSPSSDNATIDATYQVTAPGGSWDYNDTGTYTISLETNQVADTAILANYVAAGSLDGFLVNIPNTAPVVNAGSNQTANEGQTVNLDPATFTDNDLGDTHTATIDWGDGTVAEVGVVDQDTHIVSGSHVYADDNSYTVTVTVTDDKGASGSDTLTVTVNNVAPTVDAGSNQTVNEGEVVNFSGSFTDPGLADTHTIEWSFGDGSPTASGTLTPSHVYADDGVYTVTLTVADDDGDTTGDTLEVTVNNVPPTVEAGPDQTAYEGDTVNFSGSFTDPGLADTHTIEWSFGDGSPTASGTLTPSHVYADDGVYTVTLTVTDDDGRTTSDTLEVIVNNVPPAVEAGPDQTVNEGDTVNFSGSFTDQGSAGPHTIEWDFGDGSPAASGTLTPSHVYADNGVYTVTLTVTDDEGVPGSDTFTLTVNNVGPTVEAGADQTVNEGQTVSLDPATFNDLGTLDTHTATIDWGDGTAPEAGVVTETPSGPPGSTSGIDGTVSGSHVYADDGIYTVTVTVTDNEGVPGSDTFTVTANNVAPTMVPGADQTVNEGQAVSFDLATFNDLGTLDTHTATIDWGDGTAPEAGVVTETPSGPPGSTSGADGAVSGSHAYANVGTYTVTVTVTDDEGAPASATLTVTVKTAPVAVDDAYATNEDTDLVIAAPGVLGNDSDADGDPLTAILDTGPSNGTLTLNANGSFTYTPNADYNGPDSFTYHANDGELDSNIATVTITVNPIPDPPVVVDDAYDTNEDVALVVAAPGVLGNDTDADGDPLTAVLDTGPSNGTLALNADGSFTYTPNADYDEQDSFTYHANDGALDSNIATVTITVNPMPDSPVAADDTYATNEDTALVIAAPGVLGNDTDVDGDPLTAVLDVGPSNGTLALNANGSFTYTPNTDYNGPDSFTYHANDGASDSNVATVTITVNPVNDAPVAVDDTYTTTEDAVLVVAATGVLGNDTDVEGDSLMAVLDTGPANGSLTLNADGSFTYTPNADFYGQDSFTYYANDDSLDSNIVTVTITVDPVNDAPVVNDDAYATVEDTALEITPPGVLANDTDIEGDSLTAVLDTGPANGSLTLNADGSFTYTPDTDFYGQDSFTYYANDGSVDSNIAMTVTIIVYKDSDSDGIHDIEEQGPAGDDEDYDGNNDDIADSGQGNVASFYSVTGDYITIASPEGTTLKVISIENPSAGDFPAGVEAPCGFFEFTITGVATGGATTVTLILPVNVSTYYKYGPTPGNTADHWYEFMYDSQTGAEISGNVVTLHFVDGLRGDRDITANGTIVDPGGPAVRIRRLFTLPEKNVKRLTDIFATVHDRATSYFAARLITRGSDLFIVLKSVHGFSPITRSFWPESFTVPEEVANLQVYVNILRDINGTRLANLEVLLTDVIIPITEEQMSVPISEEFIAVIATVESDVTGPDYIAAKEWRDAMTDYIETLVSEFGLSEKQAATYAMERFGPRLREIGDRKVVAYIDAYLRLRFSDG